MLYFIKSGKYVKIGYAKDIEKRMKSYYCTNPNFLLLDTFEGEIKQEKFLHKILSQYKYRTEWFYNVPEVYNIWNDYKQTIVNYKTIPTILLLDEISILNSIGNYIKKENNLFLVTIDSIVLKKLKNKSKLTWNKFNIVFKNLYNKKWLVPYKGDIKVLDIDAINNYLINDPLEFDKNELRLYAYKIKFMDSD